MAKVIKYKFLSCEVNHGTDANTNTEQIILPARFTCETQSQFDASYCTAEAEAIPGTIEVTGELNPEQDPVSDDAVTWDELDAAYQEGVDSL